MRTAKLENWTLHFGQYGVRLTGEVIGHPVHPDGTKVSTSVERCQFEGRTVRTQTVLYHLGKPLMKDDGAQ